jgi:hypothetical protein
MGCGDIAGMGRPLRRVDRTPDNADGAGKTLLVFCRLLTRPPREGFTLLPAFSINAQICMIVSGRRK